MSLKCRLGVAIVSVGVLYFYCTLPHLDFSDVALVGPGL